ncbi:hypothetical protein [Streptomyces caniscabiei]|uniref:hypothetical protein n=1 Tax=Streptomyces caniscabiei TaxID=2746961 RepID=UPI000765B804|nr:hypothetical protein [Streptomyces caniscabiei]
MTFTSRDLRDQIVTATDASDGEYDVDAITEEIIEQHGAVDIDTLDTDEFWAIVGKHGTDGAQEEWKPGYGQGTTPTVHRTREDGNAYCGQETVTVGDRDSAMDLIKSHGYRTCTNCAIVMADAGVQE